jgi:hypothetical protein
VYFAVFPKNFISATVILGLSCSFSVKVSLPLSRVGVVSVLYVRKLVRFGTLGGFRTSVVISVIWWSLDNLFGTSFSPSYGSVPNNYVCLFYYFVIS